jgi:hypothetical protein
MARAETFPLFARRGLWFVCVGAALTGFWLAPGALLAALNHSGAQYWAYAALGLILLVAGIAGWARLISVRHQRVTTRAYQALFINFVVIALALFPYALVFTGRRLCNPGQASGPAAIAWLAPALAYYLTGYVGFARKRWIRVLWPLAVAVGILALLAVELIWTTGSGCGD